MQGFEEFYGENVAFVSHTDPVVLELNRLQNQLKEKERELGKAHSEIRALRATEVLKDKALEELGGEVKRLDQKLSLTGNHLEEKNLDIKKLTDEKKEALAAQYAAEATLRRVYATQKDDDSVPIELVIAPLEAELKMHKNEVAALQEDKRALERLMKSKEAALLEAERILRSALERALIVEEVQNQNFELRRQIEICQEEHKILDKTNRQKILEVEKLSQTIRDLEEAILAGGAAANTIRDYRRQITELNEEKRTLERELARVKVSANRVATIVANEWKDDKDKVMPVKQWLEERRILQAEMQKLKDKLAISERAAKAESQMKDKLKMRLKTLEEGLKYVPNCAINANGAPMNGKSSHFFGILSSNSRTKKRSTSHPRASTLSRSPMQMAADEKQNSSEILINGLRKKNTTGESLRKSLWASRNKVIDSSEKENAEMNKNAIVDSEMHKGEEVRQFADTKETNNKGLEMADVECEDMVSGFLYDRLQKEVLNLRKACELKESTLNSKDEEIKLLMKKIETLTRAIEVESKKMKREAAIREKDSSLIKPDGKIRSTNSSKRKTEKSLANNSREITAASELCIHD
ncbi:microtubule-associated protein 70-5 [Striga asiatica]|uniref:Microtubule-associated protein 70-5 n=1 Tax=Striga asiatica TaxID=4170 RepID=A0A5A7R5T2_STRAF|nr:microtubule-associated protein 70-5 [Striga asiatica]